jgi:hypothetical protein
MHRFLQALLGATLALVPASAALATGILPFSGQQQFDKDTSPPAYLTGGQLYIYRTGTTSCQTVYTDFALQIAHPCPIVLPASGRVPAVYGADGSVRVRLLSSTSAIQFDDDNVALITAASGSGSATPIPDATQIFGTRDVKIRFDDQPVSGYVRLNGRTIGSVLSGATERANADTQSLYTQLWGYANITVVSGKGSTAAADFAANKQLTLPDMAGRLIGAMDDLGNGAQSRITGATVANPTLVGSSGGNQVTTVAQGNLPSYTLPNTLGWAQDSGTGTSNRSGVTGTGGFNAQAGVDANVVRTSELQTQVITTTTTGHITGSVTSGGSGTALATISPVMLFMIYVKL